MTGESTKKGKGGSMQNHSSLLNQTLPNVIK